MPIWAILHANLAYFTCQTEAYCNVVAAKRPRFGIYFPSLFLLNFITICKPMDYKYLKFSAYFRPSSFAFQIRKLRKAFC